VNEENYSEVINSLQKKVNDKVFEGYFEKAKEEDSSLRKYWI